MIFQKEIHNLLEAFNVFPTNQGKQYPIQGKNINSIGTIPSGFIGSGPTGIVPSSISTLIFKIPKKKRKIKKKK